MEYCLILLETIILLSKPLQVEPRKSFVLLFKIHTFIYSNCNYKSLNFHLVLTVEPFFFIPYVKKQTGHALQFLYPSKNSMNCRLQQFMKILTRFYIETTKNCSKLTADQQKCKTQVWLMVRVYNPSPQCLS